MSREDERRSSEIEWMNIIKLGVKRNWRKKFGGKIKGIKGVERKKG